MVDADEKDDASEISATFEKAWYADMEGDGFNDDIVFKIKIKYEDFEDKDDDEDIKHDELKIERRVSKNLRNKLYLKIELVLPSGFVFLYHLEKSAIDEEFDFYLILYNHAIEAGWYWGHVTVTDKDYSPLNNKNSIFFDPPGGGSGGRPRVG